MSRHPNQTFTCVDCGRDFTWSTDEQDFFREGEFEPPKRCKECRQARKAERGERGGRK